MAAALIGLALPSAARAEVEAGMLSCRSVGGTGFVVGSVRNLDCVFQPASGAKPQHYVGVLHRAGLDLGVKTREIQLAWAVFAPTNKLAPGALAGSYGGVSAGAAVGVGVGGNALFGGMANSFALQPLSVEGQVGIGVNAGVSGLDLQPAKPEPRKHRKR